MCHAVLVYRGLINFKIAIELENGSPITPVSLHDKAVYLRPKNDFERKYV